MDDTYSDEELAAMRHLLRISNDLQAFIDGVHYGPEYLNRDFDCGYLSAAQRLIEDQLDPEWPEFKQEMERRVNARLMRALETKPRT